MNKTSSLKSYLFPTILLLFTIFSGFIASLPPTSADTSPIDDNITITVDSACTMGQTVLQSSNTLNPGETSTIGSSRIAAYCNDSDGYAIYAIGYTNGEYGNTNMVSTSNTTHTIPTGTSTTTPSTNSYWNMQLTPGTASDPTTTTHIPTIENNFTTSSNIPANYTKVASYPSTTIPQQQDPTASGSYFTTTYQSHISTTQPAGVYNGQVQYVMVHPTTAMPPTFMQDTAKIKSLLTNYGDTMQAIDKRDGKKYWITMLADGNIWMTQNLDFDIDANKTYTSADTDLQREWTPSGSTIRFVGSASTTTVANWSQSKTRQYSADPGGLYNYPADSDYSEDTYTSLADCKREHPGCSEHNHVGNYYNWSAAIATNDTSRLYTAYYNAPSSICPAGWRLPTGRDSNNTAASREYNTLLVSEGIMDEGSEDYYSKDGFNKIRNSPLYLTRSGGIYFRNLHETGHSGYYWTSTILSGTDAHRLYIYTTSIYPVDHTERSYGYSVRCVAR